MYAISHYRRDLCIYGGSRGQGETLVRGNGVPCDLWHLFSWLNFYFDEYDYCDILYDLH